MDGFLPFSIESFKNKLLLQQLVFCSFSKSKSKPTTRSYHRRMTVILQVQWTWTCSLLFALFFSFLIVCLGLWVLTSHVHLLVELIKISCLGLFLCTLNILILKIKNIFLIKNHFLPQHQLNYPEKSSWREGGREGLWREQQ